MSEETSSANDVQINVKGPSELKLQIAISPEKTVLDLKQAIAGKSDVEAERQRLIYSGRVLKDEDVLSTYKIQSGHTIHMVKGAARAANSGSSSSATVSTPQQLPTMQSGQNPHDPLTLLNGHMGHGVMNAGFNPFADMGLNTNDPNMMQSMMDSPQFLQQMSGVMSNPAILDQILQSNPQLSAMGPQIREMFQSERFRQLVSNPDSLRAMLQMSSMMQNAGVGPPGGPFGAPPSFPAPGVPTDGTASTPASTTTPTGAPAGSAPGAGAGGMGGMPFFNPFMFPPAAGGAAGTPPAGTPGAGGAGAGAGGMGGMGAMFTPEMMQAFLGPAGGAGAGAGGFGGFGGAPGFGGFGGAGGLGAAPAAPADARSPEERFQVQLQQLQDMGFTNASQNVRALLATGGNVHSAIEYILGGGGL